MPIANATYSSPHPRVHVFTETRTIGDALSAPVDCYDREAAERGCRKRFDNAVTLGGSHLIRQGLRDAVGKNYKQASLRCASGFLLSCLSLPLFPLTVSFGLFYDDPARLHRSSGAIWNVRLCDAIGAHLADNSWGQTPQDIEKECAWWSRTNATVTAAQERTSHSRRVQRALRRWSWEISRRNAITTTQMLSL